ncbi:hypothetical protein G6L37_05270 [Agrobacterium rubi]|nr:hypothetical protein [Agrobacterium rubi]
MRIAAQPEGDEFWLVTSRSAVVRYARSGKTPRDRREAELYPAQIRDFIETALSETWIEDNFRFADQTGRTRNVPFHPLVLNNSIISETRNAIPALPDYTKNDTQGRSP